MKIGIKCKQNLRTYETLKNKKDQELIIEIPTDDLLALVAEKKMLS